MKMSVIVPAYNEERLLAGSLAATRDAMRAFGDAGWESELIVCDNNSTDRTAEIARAAGATVVFEPGTRSRAPATPARAAASGEWLVFVDADSYPSRELFADSLDATGRDSCLAGGATMAVRDARYHSALVDCVLEPAQPGPRWAAGLVHFLRGARRSASWAASTRSSTPPRRSTYLARLKRLARRRGRAS